jgi:hypothetical protein
MTRAPSHVSCHPTIPLRPRTIAYGSTSLELKATLLLFAPCRMCLIPTSPEMAFRNHCILLSERHGCSSDEVSLRSPPAHKRHKSSASAASPTKMSAQIPPGQPAGPTEDVSGLAATPTSPTNPRKRRASNNASSPPTGATTTSSTAEAAATAAAPKTPDTGTKKKGRTNTPWTPEEEQKLQQMRSENKGWSEIAKVISVVVAQTRR